MRERLVEHVFFFAVFGLVGYLVWQIIAPFAGVLALSAIIATVCYQPYLFVVRITPKKNRSAAAIISVLLIAGTIFVPLIALTYVLFLQAATFYDTLNAGGQGITESLHALNARLEALMPGVTVDLAGYARDGAGWLTSHMGAVFAGTASTILLLFIMLIALYYMLRDGPEFVRTLVRLSPLKDAEDEHILAKLSLSVRSVVLGTLVVALIQGVLTAIGFFIFGVNEPILWGSVAAIGALIPGVGTSFVFIGAIAVTVLGGSYGAAIGLAVWGVCAVGLIDNILGPYLMSRGAKLHPFAVLLAVLGGVALFGPIGFLVGPVSLSFFTVMVELYTQHVRQVHHGG